ncbi:MAG TPA: sigma-70 family RNA polymerase sigma factor [Tepidisphaeraceae bacterium]
MSMAMSDAKLLHRYSLQRDAEAFAQIVEQYQRLVFSTCRRVLRDPNNIADATQETFLRLARTASAKQIHLGAWLHRCAMNVAIDFNRRQQTRRRHETAAARSEKSMDASQHELTELREHLDAAMEKLNEEDRELIIQRFFTGRPQTELAAEAGVAPATLSYRMEQAIEKLRRHLEMMGYAAMAGENWTAILQTEHASSVVPKELTANLMKIGLAGAPGIALGFAAGFLKIALAAMVLLGATCGGWIMLHRPTRSVEIPAVTAAPDGAVPRWQNAPATTQPSSLAGRIVDDAGHPISGAAVVLLGTESRKAGSSSFPFIAERHATSDANGNYSFPTNLPGGIYHVGAAADGFVTIDANAAPELDLDAGMQARRDIVMRRGMRVKVLIETPLGEPINSAVIVAFQHNNNPTINAQVDDMGSAEMMLPRSPEPYTVAVQAAGYAPVHAEITDSMLAVSSSLSWRMVPGETIHGVAVCSDGNPPAGDRIEAIPEWWTGMYVLHTVGIDSAGNFTLHDMGPGRYRMGLVSDMQDEVVVSAPTDGKAMRVKFSFPSPGSVPQLKGMVTFVGGRPGQFDVHASALSITSEDGHPVEGLKQYFTWVQQPAPGEQTVAINFGSIPPGKYDLHFAGDDIETKDVANITVPGKLPPITLNVIGVAVMKGNVVDARTGNPVTQFAIRAREFPWAAGQPSVPLGKGQWTQVSNAEGKFSLTLNGPGIYQAEISSENYQATLGEKVQARPGAMSAAITLKLDHPR